MKKHVLPFLLGVILLQFTACTSDDDTVTECIDGEGTIETREISLSDFNSITNNISANVTISQGTSQQVTATGHPNIIDVLETAISNDTWDITLEEGCYQNFELSINIIIPNLRSVGVNSSGNITINDFMDQEDLTLSSSGSGNLMIHLFEGSGVMNITATGSGNISTQTENTLTSLTVDTSGSGENNLYNLIAENININSSGSGDSFVQANTNLDVTISGSGNVSYRGNPAINQSITGSGTLINDN